MSSIAGPGTHEVLALVARTASATKDLEMGHFKNALFTINCTADPSTAIITPRIQARDGAGGFNTIWTAAATVAGVAKTTYLFSPGTIAADFNGTEAVSWTPPARFRFFMDATDAESITYSVHIERF